MLSVDGSHGREGCAQGLPHEHSGIDVEQPGKVMHQQAAEPRSLEMRAEVRMPSWMKEELKQEEEDLATFPDESPL
jgi:hypothetical protein